MKKVFIHPLVLSLIIVASLAFFIRTGRMGFCQNLFHKLIAPAQKLAYYPAAKAGRFFGFLASISHIHRENSELKQRNAELLDRLVLFKEAIEENEMLRRQMGLSVPSAEELIFADVVSWDLSNLGRYFFIDKGTSDGIQKGAVVLAPGSVLVGQVTEAAASFSEVRSVTDPNSRVNVVIGNALTDGLIKGAGGSAAAGLILDLVPQHESLEEGELVMTSGLAGFFPAGLLVGQVRQVVSSDTQITQAAEIEPAADFSALKQVFIIKGFPVLTGE